MKANGVKHTLTPPYHPQSNGAAERAVQTTKKALLKQLLDDKEKGNTRSLQHRIDNFVFSYRTTPHTFTGKTPAELFLRRKLRTRLSLLRPNIKSAMIEKTEKVKMCADKRRSKPRSFGVGDRVLVRSLRGDVVKWFPGKVVNVKSPSTYLVVVGNKVRFVHADHLRRSSIESSEQPEGSPELDMPHAADIVATPAASNHSGDLPAQPARHPSGMPTSKEPPCVIRRSTRDRRPPDRFRFDNFQ